MGSDEKASGAVGRSQGEDIADGELNDPPEGVTADEVEERDGDVEGMRNEPPAAGR